MRLKHNLFIVLILQLSLNTFGQIDPYSAIGLGTSIGKGIAGKIKDGKKKKNIESSYLKVFINGDTLTILRVSEEKIISPAKGYVVRIQNDLSNYHSLYQANQHLDLPYYYDDISSLKMFDKDWPCEYYENELKEYRKYEKNLTKKEQAFKDSLESAKRIEQKRVTDSLAIVRKIYKDSVEYAERVLGFHFINKEYALLKEKPSEKSKTIGRVYMGSYVRVLGYSENTSYSKVSIQGVEGFIINGDLVDNIDKINTENADIPTYRSRQYYKYEPNYEYVPEPEMSNIFQSTNTNNTGTTKRTTNSTPRQRQSSSQRTYILGPRGGCYYLTDHGTKVYVDHSYCR